MIAWRRIQAEVTLLSLIAMLACGFLARAAAQSRPDDSRDVLELKGTIVAASVVGISPRYDGLLDKITFFPGQFVEKGDVLFEFLSTEKELDLDTDRARLQRAEAQLREAQEAFKRNLELRSKNVASEKQYLEAETARDIAAANAAEARIKVRISELASKEMKLYAPITGIISRPFVTEGTFITKAAREQSNLAQITQSRPHSSDWSSAFSKLFRALSNTEDRQASDGAGRVAIILPNGQVSLPRKSYRWGLRIQQRNTADRGVDGVSESKLCATTGAQRHSSILDQIGLKPHKPVSEAHLARKQIMITHQSLIAFVAVFAASTSACYSGPCSQDIARLQAAADAKLAAAVAAGPSAPESGEARMHHQPTPRSIATAESEVGGFSPEQQKAFAAAITRAREADNASDERTCKQAVADVERILGK